VRARHLLVSVTLVVLLLGLSIVCRATVDYEIYSVAEGDTLASIATRFGVTADRICEMNGISPSEPLRPGRSLAIPITAKPEAAPANRLPSPIKATRKNGSIIGYLGSVTADQAAITTRAGAGDTLYKVKQDTQLLVVDEKGEYYGVLMVDSSTGWVPKRHLRVQPVELAATPAQATAVNDADPATTYMAGRPEVVQEAYRYWGTPYKLGGHLPYNVDCSLLVQTAYAACGLRLPRTAAEQYGVGMPVYSVAEALPGDRLYFAGRDGRISHTGLYIGNNQFIHASASKGYVGVDTLTGRWINMLVGIRRS